MIPGRGQSRQWFAAALILPGGFFLLACAGGGTAVAGSAAAEQQRPAQETPDFPTATPDNAGTPDAPSTITPTATATIPASASPTRPAPGRRIYFPYSHQGHPDALIARVAARTMRMSKLAGGPDGASIDQWDWEGGIAMAGLMHAYEATGDEDILDFVARWADTRLKEGSLGTDPSRAPPNCGARDWPNGKVGHPNHTTPAWAVLMLDRYRPKPEYKDAVARAVAFLQYDACRVDGALAHLPGQLWDDTLIVVTPLLARYGALGGCGSCLDDAVDEYLAHATRLQDAKTGLWYHAWDSTNRDQPNFVGAFWARGNGWTALSATEILNWLNYDLKNNTIPGVGNALAQKRQAQVKAILSAMNRQLAGLAGVQDPTGLWHTVVTRTDFYLETSGSAGIGAAMQRASGLDWYRATSPAAPTVAGLAAQAVRARAAVIGQIAPDGTVLNVSAGTGGNVDDINVYNGINHADIQPHGQGLALLLLSSGVKR